MYCTKEVIICHGSNWKKRKIFSTQHPKEREKTHENQTSKNIQPQRGHQTQNNIPENRVLKEITEVQSFTSIFVHEHLDTFECQHKSSYGHVDRDDSKAYKGGCVEPAGALRAVSKSEDEAGDDEAEVEVVEDGVCYVDTSEFKRGVFHWFGEDGESDIVICLAGMLTGTKEGKEDAREQTTKKSD